MVVFLITILENFMEYLEEGDRKDSLYYILEVGNLLKHFFSSLYILLSCFYISYFMANKEHKPFGVERH